MWRQSVWSCKTDSLAEYTQGFLVNWEMQKEIWDRIFGPRVLDVHTKYLSWTPLTMCLIRCHPMNAISFWHRHHLLPYNYKRQPIKWSSRITDSSLFLLLLVSFF
jgi:hypothetical protein